MAVVLVMPGCLAINAVLGIMGYLGTGPIQFAGTAYSISEYAYEYAVNDKTPDEVIEEKFAWLLLPDEDLELSADAKDLQQSVTTPMANIPPSVQTAKTSLGAAQNLTLTQAKHSAPASTMIASLSPSPQKKTVAPKPRRIQRQRHVVKKQTPTATAPIHTAKADIHTVIPNHIYVERDTDPLLTKMNRLEMNFSQAEIIVSNEPTQGILLSAQSESDGKIEQGISGSWSIRHSLMEQTPQRRTPVI